MPSQKGRLTGMQRRFVKHMAATGDKEFAAWKAGYSQPATEGNRLMQKVAIKESVIEEQMRRLKTEGVEAATTALISNANDRSLPPGSRNQAAKIIWDVVLKDRENGGNTKDLHEMTLAELQAETKRLEMEKAAIERAEMQKRGQSIDAEYVQIEAPKSSAFD